MKIRTTQNNPYQAFSKLPLALISEYETYQYPNTYPIIAR